MRTVDEKWRFRLEGVAAGMALGYVFFESWPGMVLSAASFPVYVKLRRRSAEKKKEKRLKGWFRELLYALSTALAAGSSMEQALHSVQEDLESVYSREDPLMAAYGQSVERLAYNGTVEEVLLDLQERLPLENIKVFTDIFVIANRSGGDLVQIIRETIQIMNEQSVLEEEIETMMAQKKFEFRAMSMMVPFILVYFKLASPGYLDRMYQSPAGYLVMAGAYLLFWGGLFYGDKVTAMEVGM